MSLDLNDLFPRAANTCTGSKQWYVCTAGNFRGCCSSDPCTSGICLDYDEKDASSTEVPNTASVAGLAAITARIGIPLSAITTSSSTTSSEDSSTSLSSSTSTSKAVDSAETVSITLNTATTSDTQTALETPATTAKSTASATSEATRVTALPSILGSSPASTITPSVPSRSGTASNRGAVIGGVVGGVAALIIFAILLFCCYRRRRRQDKHEKRSSIISYSQGAVQSRYGRNRSIHAKEISPSNGKRYTASDSLTTFIPSNTSTTHSTTTSPTEHRRPSNTTSTMCNCGPSPNSNSETNLITPSLRLKPSFSIPPVTPILPFSNELAATVPIPLPHRQGSTPELPDTNHYRLRCELASHSQSELTNVPIDQRRRQNGNLNQDQDLNTRVMPRAWESTSFIPLVYANERTGLSPSHSPIKNGNGNGNGNGSPLRQPVGRVVTADGVVLGANLDRYSSGMEIGRSLDRGRAAGRDYESHVMSFMHYGNGSNGSENGGSGGRAERGIEMRAVHGRGRVNSVSREGQRMQAATAILQDDLMGLEENAHTHGAGDVLPAYEGKDDASDPDIKPLAGRMEMSPRG